MAAMGLPYLPNFDYFRIQTETYTLNKTIYWMGQDSDVDEFFYDLLSNLVVQYLDTYQLGDKLSIKAISDLSLLHINARSIRKNSGVANIELAHLKIKFSVIAITETWTTDVDKDVVFFPGYKTLLKSRPLWSGYGGVGLFLNEAVIPNFVIKSFPVEDALMDTLFIQTIVDGKTIIIGVIYKPPNMNLSSFNTAFGNLLTALALERKPCYLLGDFNVNLLKIGKHRETENFVNLLYAHGFYSIIDKPTRITPETATLIDNIITNVHPSSIDNASIWITDISDHLPVCCQIAGLHKPNSQPKPLLKRTITEESLLNFKQQLTLIEWCPTFENSDVNISVVLICEVSKL